MLDRGGTVDHLVGTIGSGLEGNEMRRVAGEADVGIDLALKELAHDHGAAGIDAVRHDITDRDAVERGGEFGQEVADLVGVREQDKVGFGL